MSDKKYADLTFDFWGGMNEVVQALQQKDENIENIKRLNSKKFKEDPIYIFSCFVIFWLVLAAYPQLCELNLFSSWSCLVLFTVSVIVFFTVGLRLLIQFARMRRLRSLALIRFIVSRFHVYGIRSIVDESRRFVCTFFSSVISRILGKTKCCQTLQCTRCFPVRW